MASSPVWLEAGDGSPPLVCLHGVSSSAAAWSPVLPALAAAGHRVLAWDMPGYGGSPLIEPYDFAQLAKALAAMLDETGIDRAVIVGHSMGGMVAMEFATRYPQRVQALVLACTTASSGVASGPPRETFLAQRLGPLEHGATMAELAQLVVPVMLGPRPPEGLAERLQALMAAVPANAYRAAVHAVADFDRRQALAAFGFPVLCIAGEQDRIATPATMRRIAGRIDAARYRLIPGAGHLAPFEDEAAFAALIGEFVTPDTAMGPSSAL